MRIAVIGGTGNVGTSVIQALAGEPRVQEILALARRRPDTDFPKTTFAALDVVRDEIAPKIRGCDAVIHLAWLIQPGRTESITRAVNVEGSERVFRGVAEAGVPA